MDFDWDPLRRAKGLAERGIDFADAVAIFNGHVLVIDDHRKDDGETRRIAVGLVGDKFAAVVFTDRDETRWVITAWRSNRKERAAWQRSLWPNRSRALP